jgi:hypothetical protein
MRIAHCAAGIYQVGSRKCEVGSCKLPIAHCAAGICGLPIEFAHCELRLPIAFGRIPWRGRSLTGSLSVGATHASLRSALPGSLRGGTRNRQIYLAAVTCRQINLVVTGTARPEALQGGGRRSGASTTRERREARPKHPAPRTLGRWWGACFDTSGTIGHSAPNS